MQDEEFLKLGAPIHATPREEDLFRLASFYREIIDGVIARAQRNRIVYSDGLLRDIGMQLKQAPEARLLHFRPVPIATAPRDGRHLVVLDRNSARPLVAYYDPGAFGQIAGWRDLTARGALCHPYAFIPIDASVFHEEPVR